MATAIDIDALFSAARAAWPDLRVPREQFSAWIEERAVPGHGSLHAGDLYLACACAHGVPGAIRLLEARYFGAVDVAVARFGPAAFVADVRQELLQRLFVGSSEGDPRSRPTAAGAALCPGWSPSPSASPST